MNSTSQSRESLNNYLNYQSRRDGVPDTHLQRQREGVEEPVLLEVPPEEVAVGRTHHPVSSILTLNATGRKEGRVCKAP